MKKLLGALFVLGIFLINVEKTYGQIVLGGLPPDISVECDENIPPANVFIQDNFCDDDTPIISISEVQIPSGTCPSNYIIEKTWSASNSCGATVSYTQIITISDTTLPSLTVPADVTISCEQSTAPFNTGNARAFDACGFAGVTYLDDIIPGPCPGSYTIARFWVAEDQCQNQNQGLQLITVVDTTLPTLIGIPDDLVVSSASEVPNPAQVTATDNCGTPTVSFDEVIIGDVITRTWTAIDACGNSISDLQVITIEVPALPIITIPADVTLECGESTEPSATGSATSIGGCGGTTITFIDQIFIGGCPGEYTINRTWTATDACSNEASATQVIEVQDTTPPQLTGITDLILPGDENCQAIVPSVTYQVADNCSLIANIQVIQSPAAGTVLTGPGVYPVTITASDECGNASSTQILLTVEAPQLQVICQDISVQLDAFGNATIAPELLDGGSSGGCGTLTYSINRSAFDCSDVGQNEVLLTVTDANQNAVSCTAIVTVEDNVAPVIECLDITLQLDAAGNANITPQDVLGSGSDACGLASISVDKTSFSCSDVGENTVTLTATDVNGNSSTCTAIVTVEDVVAPIAICQNITIELDASGTASITTADIDDGSNDTCGLASLSIVNTSFTCADLGENMVTLTATDVNGNVSSCQATVTVVDVIAPIFEAYGNLTQGNDPEVCTAEVILPDLIANDNCEIASIENDSPGIFPVGSTTVTWTASDVNGNVTNAVQIITITNDAPVINSLVGPSGPVIEGSEIIISGIFTDNNLVLASVDWGDGQSSEALIVGDALSSSHIYSVQGSYNITVTVEDACGETAQAVIENVEVIATLFEGFVKGAGFFKSPKGAYKPNPHASGRFLFGFLVKNRAQYDHPKGGTVLFFRAGRMIFSSHDYEYLQVNEGKAIYEGTGRVNRKKHYQFKVTAIDGQASKTDEYYSDAIKIKIWNEDGVIYENDLTEIYAGHIWIYPFTKRLTSARTSTQETYQEVDETIPTIEELISEFGESNIMAYPNPFNKSVNIEYVPLTTGRASAKIYDLQGRIVAIIFDGEVEEFLPLSWEFKPDEYLENGVYMLRIQDGLLPQTIRLNYHR